MFLDGRKVQILQAIVNDYVNTTRPVGSERLIEIYRIGCKSATVRNEMAEMAEMGYLVQPHTSAGRIPTDLGYRYYVNELMNPPAALPLQETENVQAEFRPIRGGVSEVVMETCRILSALTSCASVATDPITSTTQVQRLYLSVAAPHQILLVLLLSTGHVEHRLIETDQVLEERALVKLSHFLNKLLSEHDLEDVGRILDGSEALEAQAPHRIFWPAVSTALVELATSLCERRVFLEGANKLLRQPEFHDVQRLENLLNALEHRGALYHVMSRALMESDQAIIIGTENAYEPMQECSIVTTSYRVGARLAGYLGIIGPTRMNYDRAVAAVNHMAKNLSHLLTNMSVA